MFKNLGNPWFVCDICGLSYRRSEKRITWKGQVVCPKDWEPKHPQLDLKVFTDKQVIPNPRPHPTYVFVSKQTTLSSNAVKGATTIEVTSASNMAVDDTLIVYTDDAIFSTTIEGISGTTITMGGSLPHKASSGKLVIFK